MTTEKALDLALEALEKLWLLGDQAGAIANPAINAIKQARALDKKAENARELGLDYEPHKGLSEHLAQATNGRVRIDPVTGDVGIGTAPAQPATEESSATQPVEVDQATMELAESVGLIGPASRTHDLHAAIQRFHDLICVNATIKAAKMAADAIRESTPPAAPVAWKWHQAPVKTSWGHDMVVADLAIDKDNTVSVYCERDQTAKVEAMFNPPAQPAPVHEPVAGQPLPCPFCGHIGLDFSDGETYRWGVASCGGCGASCGDVRREYPDQGEWHNEAIAEWNRRSPAAPNLQAELDATNRQVEILSDALAESRREVDAMIALVRADERERIKEENQRCYAVRGNT
jgi:hypothetical protein